MMDLIQVVHIDVNIFLINFLLKINLILLEIWLDFFAYVLFIWKAVRNRQEKQMFHLVIHFLNTYNSWGGARLKLEATWVAWTQALNSSPVGYPPHPRIGCTLAGSWITTGLACQVLCALLLPLSLQNRKTNRCSYKKNTELGSQVS